MYFCHQLIYLTLLCLEIQILYQYIYARRFQVFKNFLKNCFRNFPGAKINFVPKGIQVRFEMAEKQVYKQTEKQTDIFAIIILEFNTRSLNLYLALYLNNFIYIFVYVHCGPLWVSHPLWLIKIIIVIIIL